MTSASNKVRHTSNKHKASYIKHRTSPKGANLYQRKYGNRSLIVTGSGLSSSSKTTT